LGWFSEDMKVPPLDVKNGWISFVFQCICDGRWHFLVFLQKNHLVSGRRAQSDLAQSSRSAKKFDPMVDFSPLPMSGLIHA